VIDTPALALAVTIWAYWTCVGALAVRVRRRTRKLVGILPSQPIERLMWAIWVPLVASWAIQPYLAAMRSSGPWSLPEFARHGTYGALRWIAASVAVTCLVLSIRCWREMGRNWRMAVTPGEKTALITSGPFRLVRHPIYALSMLLMVCTLVVVPTAAVAVMAVLHIALMIGKALNEERHLAGIHGVAYRDYCARTGRFMPRIGNRAPGRFNLFQRMMLRWRQLHPYNPVHAVRMPAPLDEDRLRTVVRSVLQQAGLTGLVFDDGGRRFVYQGGTAAFDMAVVSAGDDRIGTLTRLIEQELNRPFDLARTGPFRFLAIDGGDDFDLALVYDHFAASGDSIARLLTEVASAYRGGTSAPSQLLRYPSTYRTVFLHHPLAALRAVLGMPRLARSARRAYRLPQAGALDLANEVAHVLLDRDLTLRIDAARQAWGVTLNDLLLANLLLSVAPLAKARRGAVRRVEVSVASVVNLRSEFQSFARDSLSPFLAAFRVGHAVPAGIDLRTLAGHVHAQTARMKRDRAYLSSILALGLSALAWRFLDAPRRVALYPKQFPVLAGVTTLNVDSLFAAHGTPGAVGLDYLRAVPTGPLCPMVFAVTAVRGRLQIVVSFRSAIFSRAAVDQVTTAFVRNFEQLQPSAHAG
jgi:protein-S-isoprenylcysteine O-methyltransferase Ste14